MGSPRVTAKELRKSISLLDNIHNINVRFNYMELAKSSTDWQELTRLTAGRPMVIERVRLTEKDIAIEGCFELPQLARLNLEDQVFVTAFVRCHGSIKEMEQVFGVSYPTIKSRLTRIANSLEFVDTNPAPTRTEILDRLKRWEISAQDAVRELEAL